MQHKIKRATQGHWGAYQVATKRGASGWEYHFAAAQGDHDPQKILHDHFHSIYNKKGTPRVDKFPFSEVERCPDFTVLELRDALQKGKKRKATGRDGVSHELLLAIAEEPEGEEKMVEWFNRLLHGEEGLPKSWARAVLVVLPKVSKPTQAKQVRPICLGAAASKLYCRMVLARTKQALTYHGSSQSMGEGRMLQLDREWRTGTWYAKMDVEKAFDSLDRNKFLHKLATKTGSTDVLRTWWDMFSCTDAVLTTVWGESVIDMVTGIRQGSVESLQMFATAMDWVMEEVMARREQGVAGRAHEGVELAQIAFVDDLIAWQNSKANLQNHMKVLVQVMKDWGLRVNPSKCQIYKNPYSKEEGGLNIDGEVIAVDDHLQVMGMTLKLGGVVPPFRQGQESLLEHETPISC